MLCNVLGTDSIGDKLRNQSLAALAICEFTGRVFIPIIKSRTVNGQHLEVRQVIVRKLHQFAWEMNRLANRWCQQFCAAFSPAYSKNCGSNSTWLEPSV
ncbi:MAG: hypothetical protein IPM82_18910 [Saprospiraceae bacterium]|nr:hypothetical protein [Saprospiraceae bacterium]